MSNRHHFPVLSEPQFNQLVAHEDHPERAASVLLEMFGGDVRKAESALHGTWDYLVGGDPTNRPQSKVNEEGPRFLMKLVPIVCEGREDPPVARLAQQRVA